MPHSPLSGCRVLDVTTSIAGPYCAQILASLGADVVKVERPDTGDDARAWGPPFWGGRERCSCPSTRASARSPSLRNPRGRDVLLRLADEADVFLQSLRPGLAEELGLGEGEVRGRNPRLVYCSVGAYGTGPLAREPGYDALMQAAGGLISVTGEPGRPGREVGSSLIDQGRASGRRRGSSPPCSSASGRAPARPWTSRSTRPPSRTSATTSSCYLADGTVPGREGTVFPMVAPYQVYPARDGELMIAAGNDRLFAALCSVLGLPELVDDPALPHQP